MKEDYQKALKKLTLFFPSNPFPLMDRIIKNKMGLELATSHSSGYETSSKIFLYSLNILSDHVWWCNVKQFLSYSKNFICKFMQVSWWHKLFHFHLSFWIWKLGKGREKVTKKSQERKDIFRWNKKDFS